MNSINQAVIFCGGLGTRLGKITKNLPKPMVEVAGKPFSRASDNPTEKKMA